MISACTTVEIIKHAPASGMQTQYAGQAIPARDGWVAARCDWVHGFVDLDVLKFRPGDVLYEYFALDDHFNAFAILRPSGELEGWYCNVTHPTTVEDCTIHWHDLYVDVLVTGERDIVVLDEDELEASGLEHSDPALYQSVLIARDRLLEMATSNAYPFSEHCP